VCLLLDRKPFYFLLLKSGVITPHSELIIIVGYYFVGTK